jgi:hypothetical protein
MQESAERAGCFGAALSSGDRSSGEPEPGYPVEAPVAIVRERVHEEATGFATFR